MYKRVLLKLSGEQLAGKHDFGVDPDVAKFLANEIKPVAQAGTQVVLVVGGGNMVRGTQAAEHGVKRVTADQMGMLSGLINAMALSDIFEKCQLPAKCLSNVYATQIVESYSYRQAVKHLAGGYVLIVAGGMGRPYFTHDTAAVALGLELDCDVVIKATKVDGVFDDDPITNPAATKYDTISFQDAVAGDKIKIMDKAALGLAMEQNKPLAVYNSTVPGSLYKLVCGQAVGTKVF